MRNQKSNILPTKNVTDTTPKNIASSCLYGIFELYKAKTLVTNEVGINNPFTVAFCGFSTTILGTLYSFANILTDIIQPIKQTITKLITNFLIFITSTQLLTEQLNIVKQKGEFYYV